MNKLNSKYIVFSAPSGAGKTTIVKVLLEQIPDLALSISATTRNMRPGEMNAKDYFFLSKDEFEQAIREGKFLEHEIVHDNYYGTLKEKVDGLVKQGKSVVFDIDVKGARAIKDAYPEAVLIFIKPPSREVLEQRLKDRQSDDEKSIKKRLERLEFEYEQASFFDYNIVNDNLEHAIEEIKKLILKP